MQHNSEHHREQEGQHQSRHRAQARQQSRCRARMPQVDDIMQHHAISHSRPHAQAQPHAAAPMAAGCSHHFPASEARAKHPAHSKLCRANETMNGLARCEAAQNTHPEHTHASQYHSRSQHGNGRKHRAKELATSFRSTEMVDNLDDKLYRDGRQFR